MHAMIYMIIHKMHMYTFVAENVYEYICRIHMFMHAMIHMYDNTQNVYICIG